MLAIAISDVWRSERAFSMGLATMMVAASNSSNTSNFNLLEGAGFAATTGLPYLP